MPTLDVSEDVTLQIQDATKDAVWRQLYRAASELLDISDASTPRWTRIFVHTLSGRILTVTATWRDE